MLQPTKLWSPQHTTPKSQVRDQVKDVLKQKSKKQIHVRYASIQLLASMVLEQ